MNPAKSTNVHTHMCTPSYCSCSSPPTSEQLPKWSIPKETKFVEWVQKLRNRDESFWTTEFWRGQREEAAGFQRENTGAQICQGNFIGVSALRCEILRAKLQITSFTISVLLFPCQLRSYRVCPPWLARQRLQQLLEPQQP